MMLPTPMTTGLILLASLGLATGHAGARQTLEGLSPVAERLRARLEAADASGPLTLRGGQIAAVQVLPRFYEERSFEPAWTGPRRPLAHGLHLVDAIGELAAHGLEPASYRLDEIRELVHRLESGPEFGSPDLLADLDLLLTDAFLIAGAHLVSGRVDPETYHPEWVAVRREVDLQAAATEAVTLRRPAEVLARLLPQDPGYARLSAALERYRQLTAAGGWEPVDPERTLRTGDAGEDVAALRRRLAASGDLAPELTGGERFDADLELAVRRFQTRHGLDPDAVVGKKTVAALDATAAARARQIELNLERWRWLPRELGERRVVVNIPDFSLSAHAGGHQVAAMRVVVGRDYRRTPVMSDTIRYLVLNPAWEVPHKLAVEDKLPEIRRDPQYLATNGFRIFDGWGSDRREVDPATVDWQALEARRFPYRLRQEPGPLNALGRIKIMFPNRFNVYLHDTPSRELFARPERDLSSGCIRVEDALGLAVVLLGDDWTRERLLAALDKATERTVLLPRPWAVHLQYWTAWADEDGTVHFRNDLYGRDAHLDAMLEAAAERPSTTESLP